MWQCGTIVWKRTAVGAASRSLLVLSVFLFCFLLLFFFPPLLLLPLRVFTDDGTVGLWPLLPDAFEIGDAWDK